MVREREREGESELGGEGFEEAGFPAGQEEGEGVAVAATGQGVRQELPHLREEGGGVSVTLQVALGGSVGVPRGNTDCEGGNLWQILVHCLGERETG